MQRHESCATLPALSNSHITRKPCALVAELRQKLDQVAGGGGEASRIRQTSRGKMLARQRVDLLIDPGTAFLELSPQCGKCGLSPELSIG